MSKYVEWLVVSERREDRRRDDFHERYEKALKGDPLRRQIGMIAD